jgi:phosphatidylinositol alpha-1,6-mannosyltransferase
MKIAYVLPFLQKPGGWRSHSVAFLNSIRRYVKPVLFVSVNDEAAARALFPEDAIHCLPATQMASFSSRKGMSDLVQSYWTIRRSAYPEVDLVHSLEAYPTGLVGNWLARKLGKPHVITTHGTYGVIWHERKTDRLAYERVLKRANMICPVSRGTAHLMRQYFGKALARTPLKPILNGNAFYQIVPRRVAIERLPPAIPTMLTVGDVKPRKGQLISLAAFARVKADRPAARYFLIGHFKQNDYYQQIQRFISDHRLKDVHILGRISDEELRGCYQAASLFLLTPQQDGLKFEGFGLVYLEAGAYGLPVVATRSGGVADAVKDGETGFLADPDDIEGIAAAILRLLDDRELAQRMGRANRLWAETLTWDRNAQEQMSAYQDVLGA